MNIKKLLSGIIAILSVNSYFLASTPIMPLSTNAAQDKTKQWEYTAVDDYAIILNYKGTSTTVNVPEYVDGYRVKEIGDDFLRDNDKVEKVCINSGVEKIGNNFCYAADKLETIQIKKDVISIGNSFCEYTSNLENVYLPYTLESLGTYCFYGCDLDTNKSDTKKLNKIYIYDSKGTAYLSSDSNASCFKLKYVGQGTLWQTAWEDINENLILGQYLYRMKKFDKASGFNSSTGVLDFTNVNNRCIQYVGMGAVKNKTQIKSINLGAVSLIGKEAFKGCTNLKTINNSSNVDNIGKDAFIDTAWYNNKLKEKNIFIKLGKVLYKYNSTSTKCNLSTDTEIMFVSEDAFNNSNMTEIDWGNVNKITGKIGDFSKLNKIKKFGQDINEEFLFLYDNIDILEGTPYVKKLVDNKTKQIINGCGLIYGASPNSVTSEYKLKAIKELRQYAVKNWSYKETNGDQTAEGAILFDSGVCASFAIAYAYLLEKCGVNSQVVHGKNHAWNLVEYSEGYWAHVDITSAVTKNDTTSSPLTSTRFLITDKKRYLGENETEIYWKYSDTDNMRHYDLVDKTIHRTQQYSYGDINGDNTITLEDANMIQKHIAKNNKLTGDQLLRADVTLDGVVDISDVIYISRFTSESL